MEVNQAFEAEYDETEYEIKIAGLIRRFKTNARKDDRDGFDAWMEAEKILRREDHYLIVLTNVASGKYRPNGQAAIASLPGSLKLLGIGVVIACAVLAIWMAALRWLTGRPLLMRERIH